MHIASTGQVMTHVALGRDIYDSRVKNGWHEMRAGSHLHNSLHEVQRWFVNAVSNGDKKGLHLFLELFAGTFGE